MTTDIETLKDRLQGTIVGGAVGDALGYEVEFMSLASILKRFGPKGITRYVTHGGVALFSDDTQMTLFTLEGLADAREQRLAPIDCIARSYLNWYKTQTEPRHELPGSRFGAIPSMWSRRAPGLTCLSALENLTRGLEVDNDSKGCGGVMRVAPVGMYGALMDMPVADTMHLAGEAAALTHKHPASTYASALLAAIIQRVIADSVTTAAALTETVESLLGELKQGYGVDARGIKEFERYILATLELAHLASVADRDAIRRLGEGWVGDEALAIALLSVLRHIDSFEDCIVCAVNHDGDSDSTGAIAGNILGAILGYRAIPPYYLSTLEILPTLAASPDRLLSASRP